MAVDFSRSRSLSLSCSRSLSVSRSRSRVSLRFRSSRRSGDLSRLLYPPLSLVSSELQIGVSWSHHVVLVRTNLACLCLDPHHLCFHPCPCPFRDPYLSRYRLEVLFLDFESGSLADELQGVNGRDRFLDTGLYQTYPCLRGPVPNFCLFFSLALLKTLFLSNSTGESVRGRGGEEKRVSRTCDMSFRTR